jgi:peroxiredoxin
MLMPRQPTPDLSLPLIGGGRFQLSEERSARGTLICFYRGLHCPICATYLKELERLAPAFAERDVGTVAISSDGADRAAAMAEKIGAAELRFAHGLKLSEARDWGLYISASRGKTSIGIEEPELFSEPGLFLVAPKRVLYYMSVQTMPFARPDFAGLLKMVDFAIEKSYPARGEYAGPV